MRVDEKIESSVDRVKNLCYYSKRNKQTLTISYRDRCPQGLNREVRCNAGAVPPLYWGANPSYTTGMNILGRFGRAVIQSQENCLFDNHRFTHARWGGDFDAAPVFELLPGILPGFFMKIRHCMLIQTVSCYNGRLSFFVGLSEIHVFLAFGVNSLAGGSFAGEPPIKNRPSAARKSCANGIVDKI